MKSKVAIVCMLKNEYSLIPSWICWHKHLGFDNFIIFDDSSTDGSREFLEHVKAIYNIEIYNPYSFDPSDYMIRQQEAYKWTLKEYKDKYEWLLFIDADEFISFYNKFSVGEFLSRFEHAHAVGVNWCQYGANGHIVDPMLPIVEAYTRHGPAGNLFSSHVKSFVRPDKVGDQWINVHCFDIAPEFYFDASGNEIEWSSTRGISNKSADWSIAKIMHYQVRSMQSFIERVKRRKDLSYNTQTFYDIDTNQIDDPSPFEVSIAIRARMEDLLVDFNEHLICIVRKAIYRYALAAIRKYKSLLMSLKSYHGTFVAWDERTGTLCHINNTKYMDPYLNYVFAISDTNNEFIFIFAIDTHVGDLNSKQVIKLVDFARLEIDETIDNTSVAISNIIDSKFYSSEPSSGMISNDKEYKNEWELFAFDTTDKIQIGGRDFSSVIDSYVEANKEHLNDYNEQDISFSVSIPFMLERLSHLGKEDCIFILRLLGISKGYSNIIHNNLVSKRNFGLDV